MENIEKGIFENSEIKQQPKLAKSIEVKAKPVSFGRIFTIVLYAYISFAILSSIVYFLYYLNGTGNYSKAYDDKIQSEIEYKERLDRLMYEGSVQMNKELDKLK